MQVKPDRFCYKIGTANIANLPDDVDALKAIFIAKWSQITGLEYLVKALKQVLFRRKSEKLDVDQFKFALEDIAIAETEAERDAGEETSRPMEKTPRAANPGTAYFILNDTDDFYRYFDATKHVEFLYECVEKTIDVDFT